MRDKHGMRAKHTPVSDYNLEGAANFCAVVVKVCGGIDQGSGLVGYPDQVAIGVAHRIAVCITLHTADNQQSRRLGPRLLGCAIGEEHRCFCNQLTRRVKTLRNLDPLRIGELTG
jgi:hypothetical protein